MGKGALFREEHPRRLTHSPRGVLFEREATFGTCLGPPVSPSGAPVAGRGSPSQTSLAATGQAGKEGSASRCWQQSRTFPPNPSCPVAALSVREVTEAAVTHPMLLKLPTAAKSSVPLSALGQKGPVTLAEGGSCKPSARGHAPQPRTRRSCSHTPGGSVALKGALGASASLAPTHAAPPSKYWRFHLNKRLTTGENFTGVSG